jgi:hypothetical protein
MSSECALSLLHCRSGIRLGARAGGVSVNRAGNAHMVYESRLASRSPNKATQHQVEPEDVQAQEPANKGKQHVQHREVNIGAGVHLSTVALSVETIDNVHREEPEAEVHPGD